MMREQTATKSRFAEIFRASAQGRTRPDPALQGGRHAIRTARQFRDRPPE
jgi:hypothetical protein